MNLKLFIGFAVLTQAFAETFDACKTFSGDDGECRPLSTCKSLLSVYEKGDRSMIRKNKCKDVPGKFFVCCSSNIPVTTQQPKAVCFNPNGDVGECISIVDCPIILEMAITRPISAENRVFLAKSQCGYVGDKPYVCCTYANTSISLETTTFTPPNGDELPWLQKLKTLTPPSPHCGSGIMDNIIGGRCTGLGEFPWLVILEHRRPNSTKDTDHCGGSLINDRYVLTAAHCIAAVPSDWSITRVRIGEWNTRSDPDCEVTNSACNPLDPFCGKMFCSCGNCRTNDSVNLACASKVIYNNIDKKIPHPGYDADDKKQYNDIALLRLQDKVEFNRFVSPICLPLEPKLWNYNYEGVRFLITGFGNTEFRRKSFVKLKANVPYMKNSDCGQLYIEQKKNLQDTQICAGGESNSDSCNGDSGGPLMRYNVDSSGSYWYLVGVVSYGPKNCGTLDLGGVYTKVSKYLEWISENIEP